MAGFYNIWKAESAKGWTAWDSAAPLKVLLVTSGYTFDPDHAYVSNLTNELSGGGYARVALAGAVVTTDNPNNRAVLDANNTAFPGLGAAAGTPAAAIVFKLVTDDTDSPLVGYFDVAAPPTPDGGDFEFEWDADGLGEIA